MTFLELKNLTARHRRAATPAITDVTLQLAAGTVAGVLGPNGSGKSTLLRTIYRGLAPEQGAVLLDGRNAWNDLTRHELARAVAVVAQDAGAAQDLRALDVVRSGRLPHQSRQRESVRAQERLAHEALTAVGAAHLADRSIAALSGGERQRVMLARAVAQDSPTLLLDEPSNHLDLRAQVELLQFVRDHHGTVLAVMHDLNLAAAVCDELHVLAGGRLVASGPTAQVLTPQLIAAVFGVEAAIDENPLTGRLRITVGDLHHAKSPPGTPTHHKQVVPAQGAVSVDAPVGA